jgi:glutathione S-transferase
MIKLYGHPFSLNARKAAWALEELGLTYEYHTVNLLTGENRQEGFLALNPLGKIPVLVDGDLTLPESNAIVAYLAGNYGVGKLFPEDAKARAQVLRWMFWQSAEGSASLSRPFFVKFVMPMFRKQPMDEAAYAQAIADAAAPLAVVDRALGGSAYLAGDSFSAADICVGEAVALAQFGGVDLAPYKNIQRWLGQLVARPAFQKTRPPQL